MEIMAMQTFGEWTIDMEIMAKSCLLDSKYTMYFLFLHNGYAELIHICKCNHHDWCSVILYLWGGGGGGGGSTIPNQLTGLYRHYDLIHSIISLVHLITTSLSLLKTCFND